MDHIIAHESLLMDALMDARTFSTKSFRYTLNKKKRYNCYSKCVEKTFKGKLNISRDTTITGSSPHNHLHTPADNTVHLGRQQMKRKAEQTSEPSKKLVWNLVGDLSWEAKSKLLDDEAYLHYSGNTMFNSN